MEHTRPLVALLLSVNGEIVAAAAPPKFIEHSNAVVYLLRVLSKPLEKIVRDSYGSNDLFLVSHGELSVAAVSRQPTEDEITQTIFRELSALCSTANGLERQALSDEFLYKSNLWRSFSEASSSDDLEFEQKLSKIREQIQTAFAQPQDMTEMTSFTDGEYQDVTLRDDSATTDSQCCVIA